ncbi:MAG: prephenate dehydrogenase [Candidatus Omnitrophota bacterium]
MRLFKKVAIVGVGLIGGSMALAIKKKRLAIQIVGVSRHKSTLALAKKSGAIDQGSQDLSIIKDADLVILATPVKTILDLARPILKFIRPDSIVCDVGSTKQEIVSKLSNIFPGFVGSHPLAGSEKRGVSNASSGIFKNSLCILTPTDKTDPKALAKIEKLWHQLGVKVLFLNPDIHDKALSLVSHLPHALAFSLAGIIPTKYLKLGVNSLKDTTRIAVSDSQLWADIFLSNRKNILESIRLFAKNLSKMQSAINKKDRKALIRILEDAKAKRELLG